MSYLAYHTLSREDKTEILEAVEVNTGLPKYVVEKDWWVVSVLDLVFQTSIAKQTVFKGGTSLSKGWNLIPRFSEDIDLALDRSTLGFDNDSPSKKQITQLRRDSKAFIVNEFVPEFTALLKQAKLDEIEIVIEETTESDQDPLIIQLHYPNVTEYTEYILPRVSLEIGIRSLIEPFSIKEIRSEISKQFEGRPFADVPILIPTVDPRRTFLEKLFLLHEEFQRPPERMRVDRLSRHLYDIHQIAKTEFADQAIADKDLYAGIIAHRRVFTKVGGVDYESHFPPNLNPIPPAKLLEAWKKDYATMQEQMIHGDSPKFEELIESLKALTKTINGQ